MNREQLARDFVSAEADYAKKVANLKEFERMCNQWHNMPTFVWANVSLQMDAAAQAVFRAQLQHSVDVCNAYLTEIREKLNA